MSGRSSGQNNLAVSSRRTPCELPKVRSRWSALPGAKIVSAMPQTTRIGTRLFFAADDGTHGEELWASDGTADGTTLVNDIEP